jgi:hypothetical protein
MKSLILSILSIFLGLSSFAQAGKITIYCNVSIHGSHHDIQLDYMGADKFLPDSLKTTVLIDYTKTYLVRVADENAMLLLMSADGWKLFSILNSTEFIPVIYTLSKEIPVDEPTRQRYMENIRSSFKSAN